MTKKNVVYSNLATGLYTDYLMRPWGTNDMYLFCDIISRNLRLSQAFQKGLHGYTRDACKVSGLTLLLRVGTSWRCGDGLFFEVPPLKIDALLTTLHLILENVLQTVDHFEISCLGAPFSLLEKPRNRMRRMTVWRMF
jgi:hypothetical protein